MIGRLGLVIYWFASVFAGLMALAAVGAVIFGTGAERWGNIVGILIASATIWAIGRATLFILAGGQEAKALGLTRADPKQAADTSSQLLVLQHAAAFLTAHALLQSDNPTTKINEVHRFLTRLVPAGDAQHKINLSRFLALVDDMLQNAMRG